MKRAIDERGKTLIDTEEFIKIHSQIAELQKENAELRKLLREAMVDVRMGNRDLYHEIRLARPEVNQILEEGE